LLVCFLMLCRCSILSLFPYTTLFRSDVVRERLGPGVRMRGDLIGVASVFNDDDGAWLARRARRVVDSQHQAERAGRADEFDSLRSEEHTSELQSRENLVCRLLLEKKK